MRAGAALMPGWAVRATLIGRVGVAEDRRREVVSAARRLLEAEGEAALSMRRIAAELGIRAPSLYKHSADKAALETALIADGLLSLYQTLDAADRDLAGIAASYRQFAPHAPAPLLADDRTAPAPHGATGRTGGPGGVPIARGPARPAPGAGGLGRRPWPWRSWRSTGGLRPELTSTPPGTRSSPRLTPRVRWGRGTAGERPVVGRGYVA